MINFEDIPRDIEAMQKEIEQDTDAFLDSLSEDNEPIKTEPLTITYKGATVELPIDFASINNEIQDFLSNLNEAINDYL